MNILFISFDADPPNMGGTATVVNIIAKYLQNKGHNVFLGYIVKSNTPSTFFKKKIYIHKSNETNVKDFFKKNSIDVVYNTFGQDIDWDFYNRIRGTAKEIVAYHSRPHIRYWSLESLLNLYHIARNPIKKLHKLLWIVCLPITNFISKYKEKERFIRMYQNADIILLLSMRYLPVYQKLVPNFKFDSNKFKAIHNPLVFKEIFPMERYSLKEKRILVVSNISQAKRIELMFKIWKKIEEDSNFNEWSFDFVGDSCALNKYKTLCKNMGIKRLTFYGKQNPLTFYYKASVFLMTSKFEGWPMVLMEAMQMGVIPIVYNSFEALEEIIDNEKNGFIIDNNDEKQFITKLKLLLSDNNIRYNMAEKAINKCKCFKLETIGKEYEELFLNISNQ